MLLSHCHGNDLKLRRFPKNLAPCSRLVRLLTSAAERRPRLDIGRAGS